MTSCGPLGYVELFNIWSRARQYGLLSRRVVLNIGDKAPDFFLMCDAIKN